MSKLDGEQQFKQAHHMLTGLWVGGEVNSTKDFRDLCWGLLCMNAGIQNALNDIHNHVRQQHQPQPNTQPAAWIRTSR
jgi:hypothetical protein